jgi:NADH:ubiquinone oxidoreductase subunit 6 (subunit J)
MAFGLAGVLVLAGAIWAVAGSGTTAGVLAIGLITLGLGAVVLLIFFEVGLSEDRAREREERRRDRARAADLPRRTRAGRFPRRPG